MGLWNATVTLNVGLKSTPGHRISNEGQVTSQCGWESARPTPREESVFLRSAGPRHHHQWSQALCLGGVLRMLDKGSGCVKLDSVVY